MSFVRRLALTCPVFNPEWLMCFSDAPKADMMFSPYSYTTKVVPDPGVAQLLCYIWSPQFTEGNFSNASVCCSSFGNVPESWIDMLPCRVFTGSLGVKGAPNRFGNVPGNSYSWGS